MPWLTIYLKKAATVLDQKGKYIQADFLDKMLFRLAQTDNEYPELHHGTTRDYKPEEVQVGQNLQGLYLTTDHDAAKHYGDVRTYKLKPNARVLDLSDGDELWSWMRKNDILDDEDVKSEDLYNYVVNGQIYQYDISNRTHYADYIVLTAAHMGYDVVKISDYPLGEDHVAWVATNTNVFARD